MHAELLLGMLPRLVHIRAEASKAALGGSIERLMGELRAPQPGARSSPSTSRWRMSVASDRLANAGMSIAVVAPLVGYESQSAFGAAFKRVMGYSPRQFAKATTV